MSNSKLSSEMNITEEITDVDLKDLNGSNSYNIKNINDSSISLEAEILYYIEQKFPDYYHNNITNPKKAKINHLSLLLNEFKEIGQNKEKYNLKWAFRRANESFNYEELQKAQQMLKTDCFLAYDDVVQVVHKKSVERINNFSKKLSFLSLTVDFLDIFISVMLIVIFSLIVQLGNRIFNTILLGIVFIGFIAILRVILDRIAINPIIDGYGWRLFNTTLQYARSEVIKLNAIYLVLIESINRNESVDQRFELIRKQRTDLLKREIIVLPGLPNLNPIES